MKKLTYKQAWLFIAEKFEGEEIKDKAGISRFGLCEAIYRLNKSTGQITDAMELKMSRRVDRELQTRNQYIDSILFPFTDSNRLKRAALARKFAEEGK